MRFFSQIYILAISITMAATVLAMSGSEHFKDSKQSQALQDGSQCTDQPGAYICSDSSTLLVCIFNVWKFQSKCPAGTTCTDGVCISTSGVNTTEDSSSGGSGSDVGSSISDDTSGDGIDTDSGSTAGDESTDSEDDDNSSEDDENSDELSNLDDIINITTVDSSLDIDSLSSAASSITSGRILGACISVAISSMAITILYFA